MAINVRHKPETRLAGKSKQSTTSIWGILIVILMVAMLVIPYAINDESVRRETKPQGVTEQPARRPGPSAAELIPVLTGGVGGSTSLGGGPSLGGGSHY